MADSGARVVAAGRVPWRRYVGQPLVAVVAGLVLLGATACSDDAELDQGPPPPAQARPSGSTSTPTVKDPVITFSPEGENFAGDPAVAAFQAYAAELQPALRAPNDNHDDLFALTTGAATDGLRSQIEEYRANGWTLFGASEWVVVGVRTTDDTHRQVQSCEYDLAAYPVEGNGEKVRPTEDRWIPDEHGFVLIDGNWKLEGIYEGLHTCEGIT